MRKAKTDDVPARAGVMMHAVVQQPAGSLNPSAYNPRTIVPQMFEALKANIRRHGFLDPIVVQKEGLNIIGGHQRFKAIKEISIEDGVQIPPVPCVLLDISDRDAKKLNISLNRVGGEFDAHLLGELLQDIREESPIIESDSLEMGFLDGELSKYMDLDGPPVIDPDPKPGEFARSITLSLEFGDIQTRDAVKQLLIKRARTAKKRTGDVVFKALGGKG